MKNTRSILRGATLAVLAALLMGACPPKTDADGDGYDSEVDCDDTDPAINPGVADGCDAIDNDCDGLVDEDQASLMLFPDADGDGFGDAASTGASACLATAGFVGNADDCDDANSTINPGAIELCDGIDQDCDGTVDDGLGSITSYEDSDGDGWGNPLISTTGCSVPAGYVTNDGDCNDETPEVRPDLPEDLCDQEDSDCDGELDEDGPPSVWYADLDGDGYGVGGTSFLSCEPVEGFVPNFDDCVDTDPDINPGETEICDGIDQDCNGLVDDGLLTVTSWPDLDGDGAGSDQAPAYVGCEVLAGYVGNNADCVDTDATIGPNGVEICNGLDDDCNGTPDDGLPTVSAWPDLDGDGAGSALAPAYVDCQVLTGYVGNNDDCVDTDDTIYPGALETCDGVDEDCDGQVDEDFVFVLAVPDTDGDGYGDAGATPTSVCAVPSGYVTDATDCDDSNALVNPGQVFDWCGGIDHDCDGAIDEDTLYTDFDGDGYGTPASFLVCDPTITSGYILTGGDCDDTNGQVSPAETEVCGNGVDDDCANGVDDGCAAPPIQACGTITTNTVWSGTVEVTCPVDVVGGATLTVAPLTVVEFDPGTELTVGFYGPGSIDVVGTLNNRVTFTSSSANPQPGDWGGLVVGPQSGPSAVEFLDIEYGGGLNPCLLTQSLPYTLGLIDIAVSACAGQSAIIIGDSTVDLVGAASTGNVGEGILIDATSVVNSVSGLVLSGNGGRPGTMPLTVATLLEPSTILTGNADDRLELLGGTIDTALTWPNLGIPYLLMTDLYVESPVAGAAVLTIADGVIIQAGQPIQITAGVGGDGVIIAQAPTSGILVTSGQPSPNPGDWQGIYLGPGAEGTFFEGVTVAYGGANGDGNITVETGSFEFASGSSEFSAGYGLYQLPPYTATIGAVLFTNNVLGGVF